MSGNYNLPNNTAYLGNKENIKIMSKKSGVIESTVGSLKTDKKSKPTKFKTRSVTPESDDDRENEKEEISEVPKKLVDVLNYFKTKIDSGDVKSSWNEINSFRYFRSNFFDSLELQLENISSKDCESIITLNREINIDDKSDNLVSKKMVDLCNKCDKFTDSSITKFMEAVDVATNSSRVMSEEDQKDVESVKMHLLKRMIAVFKIMAKNNFNDIDGSIARLNLLTLKFGVTCDSKVKLVDYYKKIIEKYESDNQNFNLFEIIEHFESVQTKKFQAVGNNTEKIFTKAKVYSEEEFFKYSLVVKDSPKDDLLQFALKRMDKMKNGARIDQKHLLQYTEVVGAAEKRKIQDKAIKEALNKITKTNEKLTLENIKKIQFTMKEDIDQLVASLIFKASREPEFVDITAAICKEFWTTLKVQTTDQKDYEFKTVFLQNCNLKFSELCLKSNNVKKDSVSFVKFIGAMYNLGLIGTNIVDTFLKKLYETEKRVADKDSDNSKEKSNISEREFYMDCFLELMKSVKTKYSERSKKPEDKDYPRLLKRIEKISKNHPSGRIKILFESFLTSRKDS